MKKLLALLLMIITIALPLSPVLATTTSALDYKEYTEANGLYTTIYPEIWLMLDKDSIQSMMDTFAKESADSTAINQETLEQYLPMIESMPMVVFQDFYSGENYNINYAADPAAEIYPLKSVYQTLAQMYVEQYKNIFQGATVIEPGRLVRYGENEFLQIAIEYTMNMIPRHMDQFIVFHEGRIFILTFTSTVQNEQLTSSFREIMDEVLSQFKLL